MTADMAAGGWSSSESSCLNPQEAVSSLGMATQRSLSCLGSCSVYQASLELKNPSASASQVLELKAYAHLQYSPPTGPHIIVLPK